jgi:hypothetical protein
VVVALVEVVGCCRAMSPNVVLYMETLI